MNEIINSECISDINYWYSFNKAICPNCKCDMSKFHPAQNIFPHYTGQCSTTEEPPSENGERKC